MATEFWGKPLSLAEELAVQRADKAVELLLPLLRADEHVAIVLANAPNRERPGWGYVTVAVSAQRFFIVVWNRRGEDKRILISDRSEVRTEATTKPEGGPALRFRGRLLKPWRTMTVEAASRNVREIAAWLNSEASRANPVPDSPLVVAAPSKTIREMTAEERRRWTRAIAERMEQNTAP